MKKTRSYVFFIVVVLIGVLMYFTVFGYSTSYGDITTEYIKGLDSIRWGIDIRGGVDVTFSPPQGTNATREEMDAATSVIKVRLVNQGITDYEVYTDYAKNRIIVRFPWKADEAEFDPQTAISELGQTAELTFRSGKEAGGEVVLVGRDIESASPGYDQTANEYVVLLKLTSEGTEKFKEATTNHVGSTISIWMDDVMISSPTVESIITNGEARITGDFDVASATTLANQINSGALPFKLESSNYSSISPTLGTGARDAMIQAGVIAIIVVAAFVMIRYRVPGIVATLALLLHVTLMLASMTGFFAPFPSFTLTLPGIAGMILSVGMAVDANIINAERIKEELRSGKSLDSAIRAGYKRAFSSILDGNITVIIVAFILMGAFGPPDGLLATILSPLLRWFGQSTAGTIYSFGYTLLVGVVLNLVVGVWISRIMLTSLSKVKALRNPVLYGGEKND